MLRGPSIRVAQGSADGVFFSSQAFATIFNYQYTHTAAHFEDHMWRHWGEGLGAWYEGLRA